MNDNMKKISIYVTEDKYMIWDADDVVKLREKYRLVGSLIGALVRKPKQTNICSLPLVLLPEEVYVCLRHQIASLVTVSRERVKRHVECRNKKELVMKREQIEKEQISIFVAEKNKKQTDLYGVRKRKRKKKWDAEMRDDEFHTGSSVKPATEPECLNSGPETDGTPASQAINSGPGRDVNTITQKVNSGAETADENKIQKDIEVPKSSEESILNNATHPCDRDKSERTIDNTGRHIEQSGKNHIAESSEITNQQKKYYEQNIRVHIPTCTPVLPELNNPLSVPVGQQSDNTLALQESILNPSSGSQNSRNIIFADLWLKGYYLTSAEKFGGDFLVYPGDPLRFHSFFIVIICNDDSTGNISSKDVVSYGRLSASVRKTVVLAKVQNQKDVKYISLNWAQMSS